MKKLICMCATLIFMIFGGINIKVAAESPDPLPTIPLTSSNSGTINFQVDDLSIYSQSKLVYLKNLSVSEVEPYIRSRLSKFGKVQINDQENLLIVSDREPKLSDIVKLIEELDKAGKKGFLRLETEIIPVSGTLFSEFINY